MTDSLLSAVEVTKRFGGLVAVDRVSFEVEPGKVFALIGPNGAGKTTMFNCVTGLFPPTAGSIVFEGRDIAGARPHEVARLGIARTFQNIRLFEYMTARWPPSPTCCCSTSRQPASPLRRRWPS
jgi:branched-chain amino acid transport system ATP-binding protein